MPMNNGPQSLPRPGMPPLNGGMGGCLCHHRNPCLEPTLLGGPMRNAPGRGALAQAQPYGQPRPMMQPMQQPMMQPMQQPQMKPMQQPQMQQQQQQPMQMMGQGPSPNPEPRTPS
jgi:hypothetical protein